MGRLRAWFLCRILGIRVSHAWFCVSPVFGRQEWQALLMETHEGKPVGAGWSMSVHGPFKDQQEAEKARLQLQSVAAYVNMERGHALSKEQRSLLCMDFGAMET